MSNINVTRGDISSELQTTILPGFFMLFLTQIGECLKSTHIVIMKWIYVNTAIFAHCIYLNETWCISIVEIYLIMILVIPVVHSYSFCKAICKICMNIKLC